MAKFLGLLLFVSGFMVQCSRPSQVNFENTPSGQKDSLMSADIAFSNMSMDSGYRKAWLYYLDSNGVLLRPGSQPITGADAVDEILSVDDAQFTMKWEPRETRVAQSGDLGYTQGIYEIMPQGDGKPIYGTYVTIWKKQSDGSWKFILHSANDGISPAE